MDLSDAGSITFGENGTTLNNSGLTIGAPSGSKTSNIIIQSGNVNMGGNIIKNVGNGSVVEGSTDAVNGGQLYDVQKQINDIAGEMVACLKKPIPTWIILTKQVKK